ncbi:MAG: glycosidase, partial [Planctomycetes bacterium]|nr:glycosidase [Planctomycetota bacterium]
MSIKLTRHQGNPVIKPNAQNSWESLIATNPAAWYDKENDEFIMIYRCAGHDDEHIVHLAMAISKNGLDFERVSDKPLFSPPESGADRGCMEDPRIVKFGEYYFITYASRMQPP